jgi:hypothetical protein
MEEDRAHPTGSRDAITPGGYRFVILWVIGLLFLYSAGACFGALLLHSYAAEAAKIRKTRTESTFVEMKKQEHETLGLSRKKPVTVTVGCSINRIGEFELKDFAWTADFNLWFTWRGAALNPDKSFRIVDGQILQQEKGGTYRRGDEHYEEHHVVARITRPFDASRFPFGEDVLVLQVEDAAHGAEELRYAADTQGSLIDPGALPRGLKLIRTAAIVKYSSYGTGWGKPGPAGGNKEVRSKFIFAMLVVPKALGIYQKLFQALFASVAVALVALYIKPILVDSRFGLPVGGFFASVSNNIFVGSLLPHSDRLTLSDMVNTSSLLTIFLVLVQSVISLYLFDSLGREKLSRLFDRVSFAVFLIGYVAVNLALPIAASPP